MVKKNRARVQCTAGARCNTCKDKLKEKEGAERRKSVALVVKSSDTAAPSAIVTLKRDSDDKSDKSVARHVRPTVTEEIERQDT